MRKNLGQLRQGEAEQLLWVLNNYVIDLVFAAPLKILGHMISCLLEIEVIRAKIPEHGQTMIKAKKRQFIHINGIICDPLLNGQKRRMVRGIKIVEICSRFTFETGRSYRIRGHQ